MLIRSIFIVVFRFILITLYVDYVCIGSVEGYINYSAVYLHVLGHLVISVQASCVYHNIRICGSHKKHEIVSS